MQKLLRIFGGLPFAIVLLSSATLMVTIGTILEGKTGSHRYAAMYTYSHPAFLILLCGFFLNILLSALRRWPFRKKHIPFLITHLGLLMVIAGVFIKQVCGVQGKMILREGAASDQILIADTYALEIREKRRPNQPYLIPLKEGAVHRTLHPAGGPAIDLLEWHAHSESAMTPFIQSGQLHLQGYPPIAVHHWKEGDSFQTPLLFKEGEASWNIYAFHTSDPKALMRAFVSGDAEIAEDLSIKWHREDVHCTPSLLFIEDDENHCTLIGCDSCGRNAVLPLRFDQGVSLLALDEGFAGYIAEVKIPLTQRLAHQEIYSRAVKEALIQKLHSDISPKATLSPPLELLKNASQLTEQDFATCCVEFLNQWNLKGSWLFPHNKEMNSSLEFVMKEIDWTTIPKNDRQAIALLAHLFESVEEGKQRGETTLRTLQRLDWPFTADLKGDENQIYETLAHQILILSDQLPESYIPGLPSDEEIPLLFSAYMKLYGIDWDKARASISEEEIRSVELHLLGFKEQPHLILRSPLMREITAKDPLKKLEENRPSVKMRLRERGRQEELEIAFDLTGKALPTPVLDGRYLARFVPYQKKIPHRIRLRKALVGNYPGTGQPASYQADLWVVEKGERRAAHLAMNEVYETEDGYRFYLANISPEDAGAVKQVQVVVNYDPVKRVLTYPGAILVALGGVMLLGLWKTKR